MVLVIITMNVLPEKQLELTQTLLSMVESPEKEPGRRSYSVFCEISDPNRFILLEEWETREALDQYLSSHRFGILLGTNALLSAHLTIQIHTVPFTEGFDAVESIRKNITRKKRR